MSSLIIGILGKIHAGKSTLARELSKELNVPIVSFGGYLREFSESKGLATDRKSLQDLGDKRISEDAIKFLYDVLASLDINKEIIIIEGIRHISVFNALKKMFKASYFIFCDVTFEERYNRYIIREETKTTTIEQFKIIDSHKVEQEIMMLKKYCDAVVTKVDTFKIKSDIEALRISNNI
jgi:adenylate kinase family enzyme